MNGLLGLVLSHQLRERLGTEIQMLYNDDGILFRCSDVERLPLDLFTGLTAAQAQDMILDELVLSPLFGALFRQNAARALLLPKTRIGKRTPLWLQRLRAGDLLQIVRKVDDFPIVIETIRDCLNDALDFEHFKEVMGKIESGSISVHTVQTEIPSPFASIVLFDFIAVYMYEWDKPKTGASNQYQSLNRELLAEVVNLDAVKTVVKPDAVERIEEQLQFISETRKARTPEELLEILVRIGELTEEEIRERSATRDVRLKDQLEKQGTIVPVRMNNKIFFIASEEVPLYRGIAEIDRETLAPLPEEFQTSPLQREECLRFLITRMLRSHVPLAVNQIVQRYGITQEECETVLRSLPEEEQVVHGSFSSENETVQWCYRPNLERIHRASINILRKEIKPASISGFTNFLAHWQHRHPSTQESGESGLQSILEIMEGYALNSELWESEIFRHRLKEYDPGVLRAMSTRRGNRLCRFRTGKISMDLQRRRRLLHRGKGKIAGRSFNDDKGIVPFSEQNGASFLSDIREGSNT